MNKQNKLEDMFKDLRPKKQSHYEQEQEQENTKKELFRKKTFNINLAVWEELALIASFQGKDFNVVVNEIFAAEVARNADLIIKIKQLKG